jgi:arginyl-tRNA synthetase
LTHLTGLSADEARKLLQRPKSVEHGDWAFPCFVLAKRDRQNPAAVASSLVQRFVADDRLDRAEAKGPYLNLFLRRPAYIEHVLREVHGAAAAFGGSQRGRGHTVVIDYSSPNIAKPLGVHHLCSTMIGHSLYRIYQALGYDVVGVNHLGDWGTQFGVLLAACERWGVPRETATIHDLVSLYVRYSREMEGDESLRSVARQWFSRLERGDEKARALWGKFRETSLNEFERVYRRLGVRFDSYAGESFYNDRLDGIVQKFRDAGLAKMDQDALVVDLSDDRMPPCILRKSDDASVYATRDLAALDYRAQTYHFDRALYVVGADQRLHFRQVFRAMELLGHPSAGKSVHVDFGLVLFGGVKGATRKGNLELLEDVLDRAAELALQVIDENEKKMAFEGEKRDIAEAVGLAAVVFGILSKARQKDIHFDWNEILSFRGNTGPYLQYAHARQASILRKYGQPVPADIDFALLADPEEFELTRALDEFPAIVERAADEYEPSLISNYLLELIAIYSRYSQDSVRHKVLSADPALTAARVLLVSCVRTVLERGLGLLGIAAPQQM